MAHPQASPPTPAALPSDVLSNPSPNIAVNRVDFVNTALPQYADKYAVILDNVLSSDECKLLIHAAETSATQGWERAMINVGGGRQQLMIDERNCGRVMWDSHEVVSKIWRRIEGVAAVQPIRRLEHVANITGNGPAKRDEVWEFTRLNERMRFLKYEGGEYFHPHCDGSYETPDGRERSYFTLHLYLNNADRPTGTELAKVLQRDPATCAIYGLVGGATTFHSYDMLKQFDVWPKAGRVLLFQHRDLLHSGDDVVQGVKYTMRTDLMYGREDKESESKGEISANGGT